MILRTFALAALNAAAALAVCTKLEDCPQFERLKTSDCQPFHHFLARGSTSPYPGHVIETVGKVCAELNSDGSPNACGYEDINYWAMNGGERWCKSAHEGAINGAAQMRNYTQRCPDSHLILMGFSQGGSVALDIVGGGGGELWGCNQQDNPKMDRTTAPGSKSTESCPTPRLLFADPRQLPQYLLMDPPVAAQIRPTPSVAERSATAVLHAHLRSLLA